jgi:hypothetical protein
MVCKEKQILIRAYASASNKYSAAVTELRRQLPTISKQGYDALYQKTEALLQDVVTTRIQLQAHVRKCDC